VRFGVCALVVLLCAVVLAGSAGSARSQGGADWTLRPVTDGQKWFRLNVQGETLHGFRLRGTDFTVTGIKSVRASGGAAPQCSVSGTPATLACDGDLPGGISVFVQLTVSGSGGAYEFALLLSPGDTNLFYVPSNQKVAPVPIGGSLGFTSASTGRVTIQNPSPTRSFQLFEISPIGFRVTNVLTPDCGITEGGGIACQGSLGPRRTAVIQFTPDSRPPAASAVLSAYGSDVGFAFVEAGSPCPDVVASVERLAGETGVVRAHLATLQRSPGARPLLRALRRKLTALNKQLRTAQRRYQNCATGARKTAAAAACDPQSLSAARAGGTVAGLLDVLPTERRVAARVKALRALPARTEKALGAARGRAARAAQRLSACQASLAQD
jgi:hypothetical protein